MTKEVAYSGRNLLSTFYEGYVRKIITFIDHDPKGSDFLIDLDVLLGDESETKDIRAALANREVMNDLVPIPPTWTKKTERAFLTTLNNNLYRYLWDLPVIEPLRQIFMARHNGMSIDTFFDLIGLRVLSNFLTDRPPDMFDTLHLIRRRVTNPTTLSETKKKTLGGKINGKSSLNIQKEFSLRYRLFQKTLSVGPEDEERYRPIVNLGLQFPNQVTDIILETWNKQPEVFWSDILEEIHGTAPIPEDVASDTITFARQDWINWWEKNKPSS